MKQYEISTKEVTEKISFKKIIIVFVIGCVIGTYYEELLELIKLVLAHKPLTMWQTRTGLMYGPFSPIYGMGAVIVSIFATKKIPDWKVFLYSSLGLGVLEYLCSFFQEKFTGTVSWDYSNKFLNINGRTTLVYMVIWGLMALIFVKYVYPHISNLIDKIPIKYSNIISIILTVFMGIDILISATAVIRQQYRKMGHEPFTVIGEFFDKYYPDERIQKVYNNSVPK